ncbi:MAG: type II secretion system F family protein [Armatimonadetes bacterium]|nr:type II secretion system F family protein [Armatimonadota bacterium]
MTIVEALRVLAGRTSDYRLRAFFRRAAEQTAAGRRLSEIMREHGTLFSPLALAMVEAAEHSGRLDEILQRLAEYYEHEYEVRLMFSRETFYPKVLGAAILLIPLGGQAIAKWLTESTAAAVLFVMKWLALYALIGGIPALALWVLYRSVSSSQQGRRAIDQLKLRLPVIGKVVHRSALARFSRALGALYGAGVSMAKALELAGDATANAVLRETAYRAAGMTSTGAGLSRALSDSGMTDDLVLSMISTGEQTGNLEETMNHVAGYYEAETRTAIRQLAVAMVPAAVILAAVVVGAMVIRFYTGLYSGIAGEP